MNQCRHARFTNAALIAAGIDAALGALLAGASCGKGMPVFQWSRSLANLAAVFATPSLIIWYGIPGFLIAGIGVYVLLPALPRGRYIRVLPISVPIAIYLGIGTLLTLMGTPTASGCL